MTTTCAEAPGERRSIWKCGIIGLLTGIIELLKFPTKKEIVHLVKASLNFPKKWAVRHWTTSVIFLCLTKNHFDIQRAPKVWCLDGMWLWGPPRFSPNLRWYSPGCLGKGRKKSAQDSAGEAARSMGSMGLQVGGGCHGPQRFLVPPKSPQKNTWFYLEETTFLKKAPWMAWKKQICNWGEKRC